MYVPSFTTFQTQQQQEQQKLFTSIFSVKKRNNLCRRLLTPIQWHSVTHPTMVIIYEQKGMTKRKQNCSKQDNASKDRGPIIDFTTFLILIYDST